MGIKQRVKNSFKYSTISGIIAVIISASLVTIDPSKSPKKVIAVFEQPQQEIFEYVTNSDEFHEWFALVKKVTEYAQDPLKVGKRYRADVRSFLIPYYINVEISHFISGKSITFKGESIFQPVFNMNVSLAPKRRSKLSLQIYYQRDSLLFQYTVAPVLNFFMQQHFQHSLFSLRWLMPSAT